MFKNVLPKVWLKYIVRDDGKIAHEINGKTTFVQLNINPINMTMRALYFAEWNSDIVVVRMANGPQILCENKNM